VHKSAGQQRREQGAEKGTGLGLAFVREIAADHGGAIEVDSAGGETTFTIVLPG